MFLWFVVLPLMVRKSKNALLAYLAPNVYSILTIFLIVVVRWIIIFMEDGLGLDAGVLYNNTAEFQELLYYYVFLAYFYDMVILRPQAPIKAR